MIENFEHSIEDYINRSSPHQLVDDTGLYLLAVVVAVVILILVRRRQRRRSKAEERNIIEDDIVKWDELRKRGVITDAEFEHQKGLLIGASSQPNKLQPTAVEKGLFKRVEFWLSIFAASILLIWGLAHATNKSKDTASSGNTSSSQTTTATNIQSTASTSNAQSTFPPPERIRELTDKALKQILGGGFVTWISDVDKCYSSLQKHEDAAQRVYCLQLDAAAFALESAAPDEFRKADLQINEYFTDEKFLSRQLSQTPPLNPGMDGSKLDEQKLENQKTLAFFLHMAMKQTVASSPAPSIQENNISGKDTTAEDGRVAFKDKNYGEALRIWGPLANKGDPVAENGLGILYSSGMAVPQDYGQALRWWRAAAAQNYANAEGNLGMAYQGGEGVPKDYTAAMDWYRKAAQQGNATAQANLGALISIVGEQHDYNEAAKWLSLAAAQGLTAAQYNLGILYLRAPNFDRDYSRAFMWFDLAESGGIDNPDVGSLRDQAASKLTAGELTAAKGMVARCKASNFKDCN